MRNRDKESTRKRILDAAMDVFSEKGYTNALIDDIAKESDTSKGAFYFHFPSKKAIFEALLQTLVQRSSDGGNSPRANTGDLSGSPETASRGPAES